MKGRRNNFDLLLCLLSAAVVFYVDCCRDPADDKGYPAADQIKPVGDLDKGTVDLIAFEERLVKTRERISIWIYNV